MVGGNNFVETRPVMPWEVPQEMGWPDMNEIAVETHSKSRDVINDVPNRATKKPTFEGTLKDFIETLKTSADPDAQRKAEIIDMELLFLSRHFTVDTSKVRIKKLSDGEIGKEEDGFQYLDPCLFNNKAFTEDQFTEIRKQTLAHELTHTKFNLDHEGLTDKYAQIVTGTGTEDYEDEVYNTAVVTDILGGGDKKKGVLRAIELYSTGQYDIFFEEFATAYGAKHPDKVVQNPEVSLKIFQLAFPRLKVDKEGALAVDNEMIKKASGTHDYEDSEGEVEQSYAMAA